MDILDHKTMDSKKKTSFGSLKFIPDDSMYCEGYDSYFDKDNAWLSGTCDDPDCYYCPKRPENHPKACKCQQFKR
jgi:hypothetical protein